MTDPTMNWKVDVSDYMGHKYEMYKNKLNSIALTKPSAYYDAQSDVMEQLNVQIAEKVYTIFYYLLTSGILPDGSALKIGGVALEPKWPGQAATTFALEASNAIDDIITKCVQIILPKQVTDIAKMQLDKKSSTLGIEGPK